MFFIIVILVVVKVLRKKNIDVKQLLKEIDKVKKENIELKKKIEALENENKRLRKLVDEAELSIMKDALWEYFQSGELQDCILKKGKIVVLADGTIRCEGVKNGNRNNS